MNNTIDNLRNGMKVITSLADNTSKILDSTSEITSNDVRVLMLGLSGIRGTIEAIELYVAHPESELKIDECCLMRMQVTGEIDTINDGFNAITKLVYSMATMDKEDCILHALELQEITNRILANKGYYGKPE